MINYSIGAQDARGVPKAVAVCTECGWWSAQNTFEAANDGARRHLLNFCKDPVEYLVHRSVAGSVQSDVFNLWQGLCAALELYSFACPDFSKVSRRFGAVDQQLEKLTDRRVAAGAKE